MNMKTFAFGCVALATAEGLAGVPSYTTLIAHRGESFDAPENTLPAYKTAVERGFGFECDIYLSKDKRLYTFHDPDLKRTTAGANASRCTDVDWATVSKLNVGGWEKWKGSKFDPTRPALFSEVLALARKDRWIYVDVKGKDPSVAPYIKTDVERAQNARADNVLFLTWEEKVCQELKRQLPKHKVLLLAGGWWLPKEEQPTVERVLARIRAAGADGVDVYFSPQIVTAEFVRGIRDAGYEVHAWTIDDPAQARQAFAAGVQTVTTNRAKYLLESAKVK